MGEFTQYDAEAPATLEAVVEVVTRLSILSDATILRLLERSRTYSRSRPTTSQSRPMPWRRKISWRRRRRP